MSYPVARNATNDGALLNSRENRGPTIDCDGDDPINLRLQKKSEYTGLILKPRNYQTELFLQTLQQNTIIYLGTGLGKTFITVLYLNSPYIDAQIQVGRKAVFLAPTQDLVKQQAEYINKQVPYRVKIFCGRNAHCGNHIDHWDKHTWDLELKNVDLMFMTPQIFSAAICTHHLDWTNFATIIFDEAHHAKLAKPNKAGHPYYQILKSYHPFYSCRTDESSCPKPRFIGLTASLINSMPKDRDGIRCEIMRLEKLMDARCVTNIEAQDKRPKLIIHTFACNTVAGFNDVLTLMFRNFINSINEALRIEKANKVFMMKSYHLSKEDEKLLAFFNRLKLSSSGFSIKPSSFPKVFQGLLNVRLRCGLWMLRAVTHKLLLAVKQHQANPCISGDMVTIYVDFSQILEKIHNTLDCHLRGEPFQGLLTYVRPRPRALLDILKREYERTRDGSNGKSSFSCIIFVTSRLEVVALNTWIQHISSTVEDYSFIKCDYAIGLAATMASKYSCITKRKAIEQYRMLNDFRSGVLNTVVTTSVLEEGIDLPVCSTVIRYDSPSNFRVYVQSRGRARQDVSTFVSLCETEKFAEEADKLNKFHDFELTLKETLNKTDIATISRQNLPARQIPLEDKEDFFLNDDKSIQINASIAKTILHMYCARLAQKTPFTEGVRYDRDQPRAGFFQTTLYLPSGCPLNEGISGNIKSLRELADNSAIVASVKALYDLGELNEHGAPARVTEANIDALLATKNLAPKFDDLDENLGGSCTKEGDKEIYSYEPAIRQQCNYLSRNCENRVYKLIRIQFQSVDGNNRLETEAFFEKSVFGFIIETSVSNEFLPPQIHSHYGRFQVNHMEISNNFLIKTSRDHDEYLNYTHRMLTNCLGFYKVGKTDFQEHCTFYIVPLDSENNPDFSKMRKSFRSARRVDLQVGQIVKESYHYSRSRTGSYKGLALVKCIHRDMNANSVVPGMKTTFLRHAQEIFDLHFNVDLNQPVVEVMPISGDFGSTKDGKKSHREYSTNTRHYLTQFLDLFDDDASCVFQSFLLPSIIYRLYVTIAATNLDKKFIEDTRGRRHVVVEPTSPDKPMELDIKAEVGDDGTQTEEDLSGANEILEDNDDEADVDMEDEEDVDDDLPELEDEVVSDDTDFDGEELIVGPSYREMVNKRYLDLQDEGDDDHMKPWNMADYSVADVQKLTYEHTASDSRQQEPDADTQDFIALNREVDLLQHKLISHIDMFFIRITSDETFLDEEVEFKKRSAIVDHSIIPPIQFDRNPEPIRIGSRERGLIEALTQRRAGELYNLEGLENIGDSYLKYATSVVLLKSLEANEGFLTSARSRLTCNKYFCHLARKSNLGSHAITSSFSKESLAYIMGQKFTDEEEKRFHNRMRPKNLADTFESMVGAYLVYCGEYEAILSSEWLGLDIFPATIFEELHEAAVVFTKAPTALISGTNPELYKSYVRKVRKFEDILGYNFNDPSHLIQAFTHASSILRCTRSYERLEFLGDAVLDFLVTATLVKTTRMNDPGQITASRSALVNNVAFAKLAMKYKYDLFIQHCNHDIYDELTKVRSAMEEDPDMNFTDMINFDQIVKLLGDSFESVAGAIYLDSGNSLDTLWSVYYPMMKEAIDQEIKTPSKNLLMALFETFPGAGRISFESSDVERTDTGLIVGITCRIFCYDESDMYREFEGKGINRSQAKQRAARLAMENPPTGHLKVNLDKKYLREHGKSNNQPRLGGRPSRGGRGGRGGRGHGSRGGNYNRGGSRNFNANRH